MRVCRVGIVVYTVQEAPNLLGDVAVCLCSYAMSMKLKSS